MAPLASLAPPARVRALAVTSIRAFTALLVAPVPSVVVAPAVPAVPTRAVSAVGRGVSLAPLVQADTSTLRGPRRAVRAAATPSGDAVAGVTPPLLPLLPGAATAKLAVSPSLAPPLTGAATTADVGTGLPRAPRVPTVTAARLAIAVVDGAVAPR